MYPSVRDAFYDFNHPFEGVVLWPYLDIKGLVTIGLGNLIDPVERALNPELQFEYVGQPGSQANQEDIIDAWNTVKAQTNLKSKGYKAFEKLTNLRITEDSVRSLVDTQLLANEGVLKKTFSNFDNWPADAQLGLLSMAWALGAGFANQWPKFRTACQNEDWDTAADECRISEVGNPGVKPRNNANQTLFSNAARVQELGDSFGYQPEVLYYPTVILPEVVVTPNDG
jgi:GH24 family phage-related lysozyme (muramidase)